MSSNGKGKKGPPATADTPSLTLEQQIGLYVMTLKTNEIIEQAMAQVEQSTVLFSALGFTVVGLLVRKEHAEYVDDVKLAELPALRYFGPEPTGGSVAALLQSFADVFKKTEEMRAAEGKERIEDDREQGEQNQTPRRPN